MLINVFNKNWSLITDIMFIFYTDCNHSCTSVEYFSFLLFDTFNCNFIVVNGHQTITTTASSSVTATTMATMVRPSVQLPLSTMANQKPVMRVNPLASESQG